MKSKSSNVSVVSLPRIILSGLAVVGINLSARAELATLNFANSSSALVIDGQTGAAVTGAGVQAALYWAPRGSTNLVQLGSPTGVGFPAPGVFAGGLRVLESAPPRSNLWFRVRFWGGGYASYEQALTNHAPLMGESPNLEVPTGNPDAFPPTLPGALQAGGFSGISLTTQPVPLPPTITNNPASQVLAQGQTALFTVSVSGTPPFAYQWFKNGTNLLAGRSAAELSLSNVQTNDSGGYSVVVSNACGAATSTLASLTVLIPLTIGQPPQNRAAVGGGSAQFSVVVSGSAPRAYQWQHAGTNLIGRTSQVLDLANIQASDFGEYQVVVSNAVSRVTSSPAQLTQAVRPQLAIELNLNTVSLTFLTEKGPTNDVECITTLGASNWQSSWSLNGTGDKITVTDKKETNSSRFYRVRLH
jgi:hypothetical protein